ncbi:MAG: IPT/TIG domain-containing protein [Acidobacteriia bacterium]|nr:IPT/TIG domain-containing protein [Terriglobia bacterium]
MKIPKIGKQETQPPTPARAKKPQVPGPEITSITPDSAPPGGDGEIVVTGKNLIQGLTINVCGARTKLDVQSPERAVAHLEIGDQAEEGPCNATVVYGVGNNGEILPTADSSPELTQEHWLGYRISNSSPMPVGLGKFNLVPEEEMKLMAALDAKSEKFRRTEDRAKNDKNLQNLMEEAQKASKSGDLQKMMELAAQMQQTSAVQDVQQQTPEMLADSQRLVELQKQEKPGRLLLEAGAVKFVAGNATLFKEPASAVKQIAYLNAGDASKAVFRIAFSDGKSYGFRELPGSDMDRVKTRLGK